MTRSDSVRRNNSVRNFVNRNSVSSMVNPRHNSVNRNSVSSIHSIQRSHPASPVILTDFNGSNVLDNQDDKAMAKATALESQPQILEEDAPPIQVYVEDLADPENQAPADASAPTSSHGPRSAAWLTLAGVFLIQLATMGLVSAFGVFQDFYATNWLSNTSTSNISWIGTTPLFLGFGFGLVGGRIFDRGYARASLITGSAIFIVCFFCLSLAKQHQYYQVFLTQGLGTGLCLMLVYTPTFSIVAVQFKQNRALAMGIVASASPLGGIIYSILLNHLLRSHGFAWAVRIAAFIALGCLTLGNLLVRVPAPPPPLAHPTSSSSPLASVQAIISLIDLPYALVLLCGLFLGIGTYYPLFYIQLFALVHGVNATMAFYSVAIMNLACVVGRIVPNWAGDKFGVKNVAGPCVLFNGAVGFAMLEGTKASGVVLFSVFYGFLLGASISLYLPVVYAVTPKGLDLGRSMGIGLGPVGFGFLIGSPVIAAVQGPANIWWKGVTLASVVLIAAAAALGAGVLTHAHAQKKLRSISTVMALAEL